MSWCPGVLVPRSPGALEPCNPEALNSWKPEALEPWSPAALESWSLGGLELWRDIALMVLQSICNIMTYTGLLKFQNFNNVYVHGLDRSVDGVFGYELYNMGTSVNCLCI